MELKEMKVEELRRMVRQKGYRGAGVLTLSKGELIALINGGSAEIEAKVNHYESGSGGFDEERVVEIVRRETAKLRNGHGSDSTEEISKSIADRVKSEIERVERKLSESFEAWEKQVDKKIADHLEQARPIEVRNVNTGETRRVGRQHKQFETLLKYVSLGLNTMIVGPAGSGKTQAAEKVAEVLGREFFPQSVGQQTTKSDLLGYMDATGKYVPSILRKAVERGGVYLLDEFDAGNANVTLVLNALLSNGYISFPDTVVKRHPDFVCIASANTYGRGADQQYIGRNKMDDATLDRFAVIDWEYDEEFELALSEDRDWTRHVQNLRKAAMELRERIVISPRASILGSRMVKAGFSYEQVEKALVWKGVSQEIVNKVRRSMR